MTVPASRGTMDLMKSCGFASCDQEATVVKNEISLCDEHEFDFFIKMKSFHFDRRMDEFVTKGYLSRHSPGYTYIIHLESGNIKIGYSAHLEDRFKRLRTELGPFKILAVIDGGETREALLHYKFNDLRVPNLRLEQFYPNPRLINYANRQGVNREGIKALNNLPTYKQPSHKEFSDNRVSTQRPFVPAKSKELDPNLIEEARRLVEQYDKSKTIVG